MSKISPSALDEQLASDNAPVVLDIRPAADFRDDHIEGSRNVPVYGELRNGESQGFREHLEDLDSDRRVVTVCKAGIVARKATRILEDEGYESETLAGGIRRWKGYESDSFGYRVRSVLGSVLP
ncbi:rhodanese-like domain-containing protein [Halostagnicola sp. A-GB9-2]|uniref:rhodanese-like domain-containing protein n=1 Tax=Halostagnicola sp. A-GB9-2 TaxID=3048066 RepID=UPI0024C01B9C|nr:rhodanese-like domain-containing protein [Halostagnicola sp. A-GB9-2]MDJ1431627.1 rhodanese-like domain-containing protein [Halostagnicola sp. A-GB9-2]